MRKKAVIKTDFADLVYEEIGLSRKGSREIINAIISEIQKGLVRDGVVKFPTFGNFHVLHKRERQGRNPKTGELAVVSARNVARFKTSVVLRKKLNDF